MSTKNRESRTSCAILCSNHAQNPCTSTTYINTIQYTIRYHQWSVSTICQEHVPTVYQWHKPPSLQMGCSTSWSWIVQNTKTERLLGSLRAPKTTLPTHRSCSQVTTTMTVGLSFHDSDFRDILNPSLIFSRSSLLQVSELFPRISSNLLAPLWFRFQDLVRL
jgi:hypothetical protein